MSGRDTVGSWKLLRAAEGCSRPEYWRRRVVVLVTEVERGLRSNTVADLRKEAQVTNFLRGPFFREKEEVVY